MIVLNIANFNRSYNNKIGTGAKFSHKISRRILQGNPKTWICKEMKNPQSARNELLSQEFFRLIISYQPETLIAQNQTTGVYYILSEEIPGYRNLPKGEAIHFSNGRYRGLGRVTTVAMFLQEIDLKNGNLGLNNKNQVTKIDGEWCFAESTFPYDYKLTPKAIEHLPYPTGYYTYNWLDIIQAQTYQAKSNIVDLTLSNSPQYRAEVDETLLKICLLPDSYLERFVDEYIPSGAQPYINLMKKRRDELRASALQNSSFKSYLKTPAAQLEAQYFLNHLKTFRAGDQVIIPEPYQDQLERDFRLQQSNLSLNLEPIMGAMFVQCTLLLSRIKKNVHSKDWILNQYINRLEQEIKRNLVNDVELEGIKLKLQSIEKITSSPEVLAVQKTINSFRNPKGFFNLNKDHKANKIELALHNTPFLLRSTVISTSKINSVQEALATHRHCGKQGVVYKTKENKLHEERAANSFKKLRILFKPNPTEFNEENTKKAPSINL
jgi:hypothetical protein